MLATLTVSCLLLAATGDALPHHLLYGPGFQAPSHHPHASVLQYAGSRPLAIPPQYVLLYPGGPQNNFVYGRADVEPRIAELEPRSPDEQRPPTIWNLFNVFQRPSTTPRIEAAEGDEDTTTQASPTTTPSTLTTSVATTVEETTPKPTDVASTKPEKITDNEEIMLAVEQMASLENFDERLPQSPEVAGSPSSDGRQFTLVQRPQFFGNYDFLSQHPMHQRFGIPPGAVSDFLILRNGFVQPGVIPASGRPLKLEQENVIPSLGFQNEVNIVPGSAALAFQQELKAAQEQAQREGSVSRLAEVPGSTHILRQGTSPQLYFAPQVFPPRTVSTPGLVNLGHGYQNVFLVAPRQTESAVVVDADRPRKEGVEEPEQAGPSVAQAKPQAIALAGVGGVAAASPVATAVVGPGGLAVSAPTATAVAGNSGGGALVGPAVAAVNKHVANSNKTKTKTKEDSSYDYTDDEARYNV